MNNIFSTCVHVKFVASTFIFFSLYTMSLTALPEDITVAVVKDSSRMLYLNTVTQIIFVRTCDTYVVVHICSNCL